MCGIAGYLTDGPDTHDRELLVRMCRRLRHRGPDAEGFYRDLGVAMGHRRLSIIDVGGGDQPLGNEDGSVQVVFNGEIYNHRELRRELITKGHRFRTDSDTEVLVHLYEEAGEQLPEFLNGMFSFAIWDSRQRTLFLARDRFGEKPLYYSFSVRGMRFCFASEPKAFLEIPGFDAAVDERSLSDFLALSYVPDPQSIFRDVRKLEAGHSLAVTTGGERRRVYWRPEFSAGECKFRSTVEELRCLAADAVRLRMISDVSLGAFLSGGVDSGAAVALMAKNATGGVKTFSIGFNEEAFDELPFARQIVKRYGTDHSEQVVTPAIGEMISVLAEHFDEPFGDSSAIPMLYLTRMTRPRATVALSGDGADEIFGGYRRYFYGLIEERVREMFPDWFRRSVFGWAGRHYPKFDYLPQAFRAKTLLANLSQEIAGAYFSTMATFEDEGLKAVVSPWMRTRLGGYSPRQSFEDRFRRLRHYGPLEQMQAVDFETYLAGDILVKADRATMAYSLESRAPWLDHRIFELTARIPAEWKIHGRIGKYIFKEAMRTLLPESVVRRRKMGFSVPLAQWFRTALQPVFEASVLHREMEQYFELGHVRALWAEHQSGLHNHDRKLWNLLMFAQWVPRYGPSGSNRCQTSLLTTPV